MYYIIREDELYHHGVKGMKWGVRKEKKYAKDIGRLERKAIAREYKRNKKQGGGYIFKSARMSTGENYNKANDNFQTLMSKDKKYKELSKKAFDAEKKRLLMEKSAYNGHGEWDNDKYEKIINSKEYRRLYSTSEKASLAKQRRVDKVASSYIDTIKEAKLKDLNITKNKDMAKKYISSRFYNDYWDGNLDFNVDNYYDSWVDKEKFK